jgi:hypothetical protein
MEEMEMLFNEMFDDIAFLKKEFVLLPKPCLV